MQSQADAVASPAGDATQDVAPKQAEFAVASMEGSIRETALAELNPIEAGLAALRERYTGVVYDVSTTKGMDEAKKARLELRETRYKVPHIVKARKADLKKISDEIVAVGDRIVAAVKGIEDPIDAQITAEEERKEAEKQRKIEAERQRVAAIRARIQEIGTIPVSAVGKSADELVEMIASATATTVSDEAFGEFAEEAANLLSSVVAKLNAMLSAARDAEEKAAAAAAEAQRLADERAEMERQRAELERQRQEMAEAQARADEERRQREAAEAAARQEELERQQREEERRQAEIKAQQDAFEEERRAAAAAAQAELDEIERKRAEARRELEALEAAKAAASAPQPPQEQAPGPEQDAATSTPAVAHTDCGASVYVTEPAAAAADQSVEAELGLPAGCYVRPAELAQIAAGDIHIVLTPEHLACALRLSAYTQRLMNDGGSAVVTFGGHDFMEAVLAKLNEEAEDGSTPLSRCVEDAMEAAIEDGCSGVEIHEAQESA